MEPNKRKIKVTSRRYCCVLALLFDLATNKKDFLGMMGHFYDNKEHRRKMVEHICAKANRKAK